MKKYFFLILLGNFSLIAYSQIISGTLLDIKTHDPVLATIYFNGTYTGTTSDPNGKFTLDISAYPLMPLTISSVGYYSVTLDNYLQNNPQTIYLTPKTYELKDVVITSSSLFRKRKGYLNTFKRIFLGTTYNAMNCIITNENDIIFDYNCRDTIKAFASKPILITNKALGYKISYYLDKFEFRKKKNSYLIMGNIIFNEDLSVGNKNNKVYRNRRNDTYLGSKMQFFRALWSDSLQSTGFVVRNADGKNLSYNDIVIQEDCNRPDSLNKCEKFLRYGEKLLIRYNSDLSDVTLITSKVLFDINGNFDYGLEWGGEMALKRIGDILPAEFRYQE